MSVTERPAWVRYRERGAVPVQILADMGGSAGLHGTRDMEQVCFHLDVGKVQSSAEMVASLTVVPGSGLSGSAKSDPLAYICAGHSLSFAERRMWIAHMLGHLMLPSRPFPFEIHAGRDGCPNECPESVHRWASKLLIPDEDMLLNLYRDRSAWGHAATHASPIKLTAHEYNVSEGMVRARLRALAFDERVRMARSPRAVRDPPEHVLCRCTLPATRMMRASPAASTIIHFNHVDLATRSLAKSLAVLDKLKQDA